MNEGKKPKFKRGDMVSLQFQGKTETGRVDGDVGFVNDEFIYLVFLSDGFPLSPLESEMSYWRPTGHRRK